VTEISYRVALIVGAGSGISASFARGLAATGLRVGLAARNGEKNRRDLPRQIQRRPPLVLRTGDATGRSDPDQMLRFGPG
jgi:NADP-dependent 3-hydroxy acid dehydrogenase YdfG